MKTPLQILTATSVVLAPTLSSSLSWAMTNRDRPSASAPTLPPVQSLMQAMQYVPPRSPEGDRRLGNRRAVPVRGGCLISKKITNDSTLDNLVALVPDSNG